MLLAAVPAFAAPHLALNETEFDFGSVPGGQTVSHVFWLKSVGEDTLKIIDAKPGCGCTKAPLEKTLLAPGDSTRLEVIFTAKKTPGKIAKSVQVMTNEVAQAKVVRFTAVIEDTTKADSQLGITPRVITLANEPAESQKQTAMALANLTDHDLALRLIEWPREYVKPDFPTALAAGNTVYVQVTLDAGARDTTSAKSCTFEAGAEKPIRYTVPIICTRQSLSRR